jgi:Flp pilus assembly protein TadD/glutathione synthase/RimK-type ligase-like ATP-grasp enzyme
VESELRHQALRNLDEQLAASPDSAHLLFDRACLLHRAGRTTEARDAYLDVLARDPSHKGALNNLGTLLYETRYRSAAKTAYMEAVARHPDDPMGHVNLANLLHEEGELAAARDHYEIALQLEPDHHQAHQGLAYVLAGCGDEKGAELHRQKGFQDQPVIELPYRGEGTPVFLLLLVSAVGGNTPTRNFLDDRVFHTFVVVAEFFDPAMSLPPHQLVFNAISDADLAAPALAAAKTILSFTKAPVLNQPSAVQATRRTDIAQRFSNLTHVVTPKTVLLSRENLLSPDAMGTLALHGFEFPILLRTPGCHTGQNFLLVEREAGLAEAVAELPGRDLLVIQYLDARASDGKVRKYRVMMIDGELYPLHLAISSHWKVHYFTAEMSHHPEYRAEEAGFLENMPTVLDSRAMTSLAEIQKSLGLDYAGIDFNLSNSGEIQLFEVNATMVVNPPDANEMWAYRRQAVDDIYAAVRRMLVGNASSISWSVPSRLSGAR